MISNNFKTYNIILTGYGGQGVLTMAEILARAALIDGYQVKQAELHGLAQRGGSLECHLRLGKKIFSPLVMEADADLIIGLDLLETLSACYYAQRKKTVIIANDRIFSPAPFQPENFNRSKIVQKVKKFSKQLKLVPADRLLKKIEKETAMVNILMLGFAAASKKLPIRKQSIVLAMREKIRTQFLADNQAIFQLAFKS